MTNKILVIAAMHRSGSSLISHWLNKCGLNLGSELVGPGIGNAEGHFEDKDFYNLHEEILGAHRLPNSGLTCDKIGEVTKPEIEKIKSLIEAKNTSSVEWGWKDPRTCLFLPVYKNLLPQAHYLIIVRDYQSTVTSLINREYNNMDKRHRALDWFTRFFWKVYKRHTRKKVLYQKLGEYYLKVWIAYNEKILNEIDNLSKRNYVFVDYTTLKQTDKIIFSKLNKWGFHLNYIEFKSIFKKTMISDVENFEMFIKDKALLHKANRLNELLQQQVANTCLEMVA